MTPIHSSAASPASRDSQRCSVLALYLVRGVLAVAWAALFAHTPTAPNPVAVILLVIYPLIDAVSCLIDYRENAIASQRRVTAFNGLLSLFAALAMGVAGHSGVAPALAVFGAWATIAGAAQFLLGLRRRGAEFGRQWPMLIAGGLSFIVGIFYDIQAVGATPSLNVLAVYASGGGLFFIVQAALLAWRSRHTSRQLA